MSDNTPAGTALPEPTYPLLARIPPPVAGLGALADVVAGADPVPVGDPAAPPYAAIGWVRTASRHLGTGFLVRPDRVLTAAHLFASMTPQEFATVHVVLGGGAVSIAMLDGLVLDSAAHAAGQPGDVALLRLAHPPAGIAPLPLSPGAAFTSMKVEVSGYPTGGLPQLRHTGPIVARDQHWIDYALDTMPGHSGAPVLAAGPGMPRAVVGLHVLPPGQHPQGIAANRGILITEGIVTWIRTAK
jgi:V8-like Glu-specific endopeptidase